MNPRRTARILVLASSDAVAARLDAARRHQQVGPTEVERIESLAAGHQALLASPPDLLLLDHARITEDELGALGEIVQRSPATHVVILSEEEDPRRIERLLGAGAVLSASVPERCLACHLSSTLHRAWRSRDGEVRYRELFEHMDSGVAVFEAVDDGADFRFLDLNRAAEWIEGLARRDVIGRTVLEVFPGAEEFGIMEALRRVWRTGRPEHLSDSLYQDPTRPPSLRDNRIHRLPDGKVVSVYRDVTEQRRLEAEQEELRSSLAQSDRLASMGMLAAGVAHEINNPLAFVLSNLEALAERLPDEELAARAREALEGTYRIRAIVRGLGTFSKVESEEVSRCDVGYAIECAAAMAQNEIKYRARLVKELADLPPILASDGRLSQVILNLLINAAHAIGEGAVDENEIRIRAFPEGEHVVVQVQDTGKGVAPEDRERIFDPFFSTKGVGAGSGLGLAICKNLVEGFGGEIELESEVGRGTCFSLRFPAAQADPDREPVAEGAPGATPGSSAGVEEALRGRVLIVDDEEGIRSLLTRILRKQHDVVAVASGEEARDLLTEDAAFDAVLCDMMMPGMTGMDLHRWMVEETPDLAERLIFVSGGAFTPRAREYLEEIDNPQLGKPFDKAELRRLLAKMVQRSRAAGEASAEA